MRVRKGPKLPLSEVIREERAMGGLVRGAAAAGEGGRALHVEATVRGLDKTMAGGAEHFFVFPTISLVPIYYSPSLELSQFFVFGFYFGRGKKKKIFFG